MLGAFRGERTAVAPGVRRLAILLLVVAARSRCGCLAGTLVNFGGSFVVILFRALSQAACPDPASARRAPHVVRLSAVEKQQKFRVPDPDPASDPGMLNAHLGGRSHRALSRPLIDEPGALLVAAINREFRRSAEAGLKYFILGALSSSSAVRRFAV